MLIFEPFIGSAVYKSFFYPSCSDIKVANERKAILYGSTLLVTKVYHI
jgi:hypothetical protein